MGYYDYGVFVLWLAETRAGTLERRPSGALMLQGWFSAGGGEKASVLSACYQKSCSMKVKTTGNPA